MDAFIFSVCGKIENQGTCPFRERVKHMGNVPNLSDSGTTTFGKTIPVSNKTLICIDEAQDNDMLYCSGFISLALNTYADIYLCGDTLQCLKHEKNLLTDTNEILNDGKFIKFHDDGNTNNTRRFGPSISNFVNELIPFEKYGRPRMTSDFTDEERFNEVFKNRREPNNILSGVNIEYNVGFRATEDLKNKWYHNFIRYIKNLIETNHLVPEDIIISFPVLMNNEQACNLENIMNEMWIKLFDDPKYINNTLKYHPYWKNQNKVSDYCQLHSSAGDGSININESDRKTRICSIHTVKGDGRPVSISFLSENMISKFAHLGPGSKEYVSFVHVAMTRPKLKLIIFTCGDDGEIYDKLIKIKEKLSITNKINTPFPDSFSTIHHIQKMDTENISSETMNEFCQEFKDVIEPIQINQNSKENDMNEDMEHHLLRGSMVHFYILRPFIRGLNKYYNQVTQILKYIVKLECVELNSKNYRNFVFDKKNPKYPIYLPHENDTLSKTNSRNSIKIYGSLQGKLNNGDLNLCPLECILLEQARDIIMNNTSNKKSSTRNIRPMLTYRVINDHLPHISSLDKDVHSNCKCSTLSCNECNYHSDKNKFYEYAKITGDIIDKDVSRMIEYDPSRNYKLDHLVV